MRKTIPQLEPEVVRAEADKLRHGDDQKCATTSIKELRVRDVRITSRYQKADKLGSRSPRIFSFDLRFELRLAANAHTREASRHAPLLLTTLLGVPSMTRLDHAAEAGLHGWWCPVLDQGNGFTVAALGSVGTNRHPGDEGGTMKSALFAPLAIACWLLVPAPPSRAQQVSFSPAGLFAVGVGPGAVAVGDFNGDGVPDLAVANTGGPGNTVSILLGTGTGGFAPGATVSVGDRARTIAVGDFNGDGKPDLAVTTFSLDGTRNNVAVLLGTGAGTFGAPTNFPVGAFQDAVSVAVGDFRGIGVLDLVLVSEGFLTSDPGTVSILLGTGAGTFGPPSTFPVAASPKAVAVGDFNGDGTLDVAVCGGDEIVGIPGTISIFLGTGAGSFGAPMIFPAGQFPGSVAVGDLNGDGKLDLVVSNAFDTVVSVVLGKGDGSFEAPAAFPVGAEPVSVALADFNGDGKLDLAVTVVDINNVGSVAVLLGTGTGAFGPATNFPPAGKNPQAIAVGDFNRDGKPDLAVVNFGSDNVSILLNTTPPPVFFGAQPNVPVGIGPVSLAVGDFNGDGLLDLAAATIGVNGRGNTISVLLGTGGGGFGAPTAFTAGPTPFAVAVGDFNRDGNLDLVVANVGPNLDAQTVSILLGTGTGTFGAPTDFTVGTGPISVAVGDFNGDGVPDLATANFGSNNVSILLGTGTGGFGPATNFPVGTGPVAIAIGDFNGDGNLDLAVANQNSSNVSILLGTGTGGFAPGATVSVGDRAHTIAVGDFNGDGKPDLAVTTFSLDGTRNNVAVLLGTGTGDFGAPVTFAEGPSGPSFQVGVGDFNGDGAPDLAVVDSNNNTVSVLLGTGSGSFLGPTTFAVGTRPEAVAVGDFDGDGRLDLAVANNFSNDASILLNRGR